MRARDEIHFIAEKLHHYVLLVENGATALEE